MSFPASERLSFRNWQDSDRTLFHLINSDDRVMEFFPFRRTRAETDAKMDEFAAAIDKDGFGFTPAVVKTTGEPIGFIGITDADHMEPHLPRGTIQICWRLAPQFWGMGYATEGANAWLRFGFEQLGLDEIVSFAVWNNTASLTVMQRIGMRPAPEKDFDDPQPNHPHLERTVVYRLTREDWRDQQGAA